MGGISIEYRRYGNFRLSDYIATWIGIAVLLTFAIAGYILELPIIIVVFPLIYAVITLWAIISPNCECFSIDGSVITARKGKKVQKITIPAELTLVISYADISPPLVKRTAIGNKTHILKDKYAISVLRKMPIESTLVCLHRNHVLKYTTSMIKDIFEHQFVYSFVCNQTLLDNITQNKECFAIVPESLVDKIPAISQKINIYIDSGY